MGKNARKEQKRIQIQDVDGIKRNLRFSEFTKSQRESWKAHAKRIVQCRRQQEPLLPSDERWLKARPTSDQKRLAVLGVLAAANPDKAAVEKEAHSLNALLDACIAAKSNHRIAPRTLAKWRRNADRVKRFFTVHRKRKDLRDITQDDAEAFYSWLIDVEGLAEGSTANRVVSDARSFFNRAVKQKLIECNPFLPAEECSIRYTVQANEDKWHDITQSEKSKIWSVLTEEVDQLRFLLMIRLGLRCPSELNELKWKDIDWQAGMVEIRSAKLKRYPKHYCRRCPITFPDLLPLLKSAYEKRRGDKANIVKPISNASLTKKVRGWLGRAGLEVWPDLLVNFRRTAITDACEIWPSHVVAAYFGHSEAISRKHYRMTNDEQGKKAANVLPMFDEKDGAA